MLMSQTHGHSQTQETVRGMGPRSQEESWACRRCSTWASIENDVAPSIFHGFMTNLLYGFHSGLRHHSLFGHLRAQETIRESRSGDKSDELKVDRSFVHDHVCAARPLRGSYPGDFELDRVENGSCPPRLVVGCVGLRSRVCIAVCATRTQLHILHISAPDGDSSHSIPSPYASPSISAARGTSLAKVCPPIRRHDGEPKLISPSISSTQHIRSPSRT